MTTKQSHLLCIFALLLTTHGCGGKKSNEPLDPAVVIEKRLKGAEKISDPAAQAEEYLAIAREQQRTDQTIASHKPLKLAGKAIEDITNPATKGRLSAELAIFHARAKQSGESQEALAQAQAALGHIKDDPLAKTLLQTRIAVAQQELGSKKTAHATLSAASNAAGAIMDVESQSRAWLGVAKAAKLLDDTATEQMAFDKALATARSAATSRTQSELIIALARMQHEQDLKPAAEESLKLALATAEQIVDPLNRGYALLEVAAMRIRWGEAELAGVLLEQLEKSYAEIVDKDQLKQLQAKVKVQRSELSKLKN